MAFWVIDGAILACIFGAAPSQLKVLPHRKQFHLNKPMATIMDHQPMVNIQPFGACMCPANPQVAAATALALGVLTPQPCQPATFTPWTPGSPRTFIATEPALNDTSICQCLWGGVVSVTFAGQAVQHVL